MRPAHPETSNPAPNIFVLEAKRLRLWQKNKIFFLSFLFFAVMAIGFLALGLWSWYGALEESVPGFGQILPEGKVRRIMSPISGMITKVYVKEDDLIKKGQVLAELDPEPTDVEDKGLKEQLALLQEEANALKTAVSLESDISTSFGSIQSSWLSATQQAYQAQMAEAEMQIKGAGHTYQETLAQIKKVKDILKTGEKLLQQYEALYNEGGLPEKELREYEQQVSEQRGELAALNEKVRADLAALEQARERPREIWGSYRRDILSRLAEHERSIADLKSQIEQTQITRKHQTIKAPLNGIVQDIAFRGPGEVVTAGEALLSIIPSNEEMVAEVQVANRELSYIHIGQRAAFYDWVTEPTLVDIFRLGHCHIYWTVPHTLSWSCFQAMSCGALVIASNAKPVRDIIEDGVNGLMVEPYDLDGFVERIIEAVDNPEKFKPLREAARESMASNYSFEVCLPPLAEFYLNGKWPDSQKTPSLHQLNE